MLPKLVQLAWEMLKLGFISFGGPAAHIALMETVVVERRRWIDRQRFLDLLGATHLMPGPNAVEMAIHIGYVHSGYLGGIASGIAFTVPAVAITLILSWVYVAFGTLPQAATILAGIKPAMLGVIIAAVFRLGQKAIKNVVCLGLALAATFAVLCGLSAIAALLVTAAIGTLVLSRKTPRNSSGKSAGNTIVAASASLSYPLAFRTGGSLTAAAITGGVLAASVWLFFFFFKVGCVMYGGGYVLLAYIEDELVGSPFGITQQHVLDAVAVGQITPGPMLSTATFVGFLVAGTPGALAATLGILLPCFLFVSVANPLLPQLRASRIASHFLDAVNAASIGLMAAVTLRLGWAALINWQSAAIASTATALVILFRISPAWLVVGGILISPLVR